jgi:DNA polymerase-3 subunit delta'
VNEVRYNIQHINALQTLTKSVNLALLFDFQRRLEDARKTVAHPLNHELQLEGLLLQYTQIFTISITS